MKRRKVEFSSHTANLALLRKCVRDFLNGYPFSEKARLLMVLGVDEACTNVIRYAYRLRDDQPISLQMEGLRKCVRMRLRDYGEKVFPHAMKRPPRAHSFARSVRTRQDHARLHHRQCDGGEYQKHQRPCH